MVPLYQSVLSGLLIGLKGEIGGSLRVCPILASVFLDRYNNKRVSVCMMHIFHMQSKDKNILCFI